MNTSQSTHREPWIDFAKGVTLLLVIIGHTVSGVLSGAIYSFHMPLFFILSGITMKPSLTSEQFKIKAKHSFKRLMLPFFIIYTIQTVVYLFRNLSAIQQDLSFFTTYITNRILTGIFARGVTISVFGTKITHIGVIWFFPALFIGKTLFDYMHYWFTEKQLPVFCVLCSIAGVLIGKLTCLPFSFDVVLVIIPLFYIGQHFNVFNVKKSPLTKFFIYSFIWGILLIVTYIIGHHCLELASRRYPAYPLCFITALAGTLMVSEFSVLCCQYDFLSRPLQYIGKNSLYLLCIHTLEWDYLTKLWNVHPNMYICTILRIILDLALFSIFMLFRSKCLKHS